METRTCDACGLSFTNRQQNPNQHYCSRPECQRERRRRWQQKKRRQDSDYRDNDTRAAETWAAKNPGYWKQYRDKHPAYTDRNRTLQRLRNQKKRAIQIANEDTKGKQTILQPGRYRIAQILADGIIDDHVWIVEITPILTKQSSEDA